MEIRTVVERLEHQPLTDAVDHSARLFTPRIETKVLQNDKTVEGNQVPFRPASPMSARTLTRETLSSPAFCCHARTLGGNCLRRVTVDVPHNLPPNAGVRIEEPFNLRGVAQVRVSAHCSLIACDL